MARSPVFLPYVLFSVAAAAAALSNAGPAMAMSSKDGLEEWGYARVRPKAHMFWWLYKSPYRVEDLHKPWPIILWLQGGPGASGVGIGNFQEIGPLDTSLKPRNSTWLKVADLLFVDNPVGSGFSFVEDEDSVVKSDEEAAADLTKALMKIFNNRPALQKSPLYLVAESYGGKYAVTTALCALRAINAGTLHLKLGGVALGDSWISPEDFVLSWGPLLRDVSRLDDNGMRKANSAAEKIKQQIRAGQYENATNSWSNLEDLILLNSNDVDFYNFLYDSGLDPAISTSAAPSEKKFAFRRYSSYLNSVSATNADGEVDLDTFMNGPIKQKLKIIPENIS
ncbi:Serine carboxypeptidase-like 51 [Dionaea muscipula]